MSEIVSRGDPKRSMELLWGAVEPPTRGPKQGLTVADIVRAGIDIADSEGIAALSMRKVAERLGKSAMSLYTYVPGKAELLDVMLDTVVAELRTDISLDDGWRPAVEAHCRDLWAMYERHPWVLQIVGSRPTLGPGELTLFELQLRLVDGLGMSGTDMGNTIGLIAGYVGGAAKTVADAKAAEHITGVSDDDWWNARSPLLDLYWDPARFPIAERLSQEQAFDQLDRAPDDATPYLVRGALDAFEFGLQRVLDGIEAYIATINAPKAKPAKPTKPRAKRTT
jgi:AcrR family transcriptional regulator